MVLGKEIEKHVIKEKTGRVANRSNMIVHKSVHSSKNRSTAAGLAVGATSVIASTNYVRTWPSEAVWSKSRRNGGDRPVRRRGEAPLEVATRKKKEMERRTHCRRLKGRKLRQR